MNLKVICYGKTLTIWKIFLFAKCLSSRGQNYVVNYIQAGLNSVWFVANDYNFQLPPNVLFSSQFVTNSIIGSRLTNGYLLYYIRTQYIYIMFSNRDWIESESL